MRDDIIIGIAGLLLLLGFALTCIWPLPEYRRANLEHYEIYRRPDGKYTYGYRTMVGYVDYNGYCKCDTPEECWKTVRDILEYDNYFYNRRNTELVK